MTGDERVYGAYCISNVYNPIYIIEILFGDENIERRILSLRDDEALKYSMAVPSVCIKKLGSCDMGTKTIVPITRLTKLCKDGLINTLSKLKGEDFERAAIDIIYEIFASSLSRKQMRAWVFDVLPYVSARLNLKHYHCSFANYGHSSAVRCSKAMKCNKISEFLTLNLPIL